MTMTGERMVPEESLWETFWEHIYRYRFACRYAHGRRVLDVASGTGYGAGALCAAGARSVVGLDLDGDACRNAKTKYGVTAVNGSALDMPFRDACFDMVTSFETIEHLPDPTRFVEECVRVLVPDGQLIISTPNRDALRTTDPPNPFHIVDLTGDQVLELLHPFFARIEKHSQCITRASWYSPRSLAASASLWHKVPGYWRLRYALLPHLDDREDRDGFFEWNRQHPVEAIRRRENRCARWLNPFLVQSWSNWALARPRYLIAVVSRS
jgi:SAM-dependent methyltransferase